MAAEAHRRPLDRASVLAAAVRLADAEGLDAVSMRRLGDALGVVPMALYKHVADKEDLLDGMVGLVIARDRTRPVAGAPDPALADPDADWRQGVREAILGARRESAAHPWLRRAIETRARRTPAVLDHMERLTSAFLTAGFSPDLAHHVMHLLGNRIWGFSPELFNAPEGAPAARPAPTLDPADYPAIVAVAADAHARRPDATGCDEDFEFDFALDVILDAAERLRAEGWSSRR